MQIETFIGWVGASVLLIGYLLNSLGFWSNKSLKYHLINLFGSLFLVYNAFTLKTYPFILINIFWVIISLAAVFHHHKK